jgi:outer membrane murein-binding lipoprotein Lpp
MTRRTQSTWAATVLAVLLLAGCQTDSRTQVLATTESQLALRQMQSRAFDTTDRNMMLRTVVATLQDLSFVIDEADAMIGSVSGTKLDGYRLRMTVSIRPRGETQLLRQRPVQRQGGGRPGALPAVLFRPREISVPDRPSGRLGLILGNR